MEAFINQFECLAVASLIFLETVFPSIPSEVILPMAGFLTISTGMTLLGMVIASTVGACAGAFILYGVGHVLSRERLVRFFETRPLRLLEFKGSDVERVIDWFDRRRQITVLAVVRWIVFRAVPVWREGRMAERARRSRQRFAIHCMHSGMATTYRPSRFSCRIVARRESPDERSEP